MTPEEFKAIRNAAGLTQMQLAALLRVTGTATIYRWEHGERAIPGPVTAMMEMIADGRLEP